MADGDIGFHCNACGKCCNSPPAMSVPELMRHGDRFIGSLTVGRVKRLVAGSRIAEGGSFHQLDAGEAADLSALRGRLFHDPDDRSGFDVTLLTQAFDYSSLARCPALADDGGCAIHGEGKPLMCRVVPLDPYLPDSLQHSVLVNRRASAAFMGAECISSGIDATYQPLVQYRSLRDAGYRDDLQQRRSSLVDEKRDWGGAVFSMLKNELRQSRQSDDGYLVLPLAPVLAVLAAQSEAMRARCVDYIDSQLALIDAAITVALERRHSADREVTAQLRAFAQAYSRQRPLLVKAA
ncbi:MAG: hypothetical protein ABIT83_04435 [Massilia sp.]